MDKLGLEVCGFVFVAILGFSFILIPDYYFWKEAKEITKDYETPYEVKLKLVTEDNFKSELIRVLNTKNNVDNLELSGGCQISVNYEKYLRVVSFMHCQYITIDYNLLRETAIEENKIKWCNDNWRKDFGFYSKPDNEKEIFYCDQRRTFNPYDFNHNIEHNSLNE